MPNGVPPIICCAARVCCDDLVKAREATINILKSMGARQADADLISQAMEDRGIVFMPVEISHGIRNLMRKNGNESRGHDLEHPAAPI